MLINPGDIVDGTLVSAIAATGRMLAAQASSLRSRHAAADIDIARWFNTDQLTGDSSDVRLGRWQGRPLPELPLPEGFKQLFRDWAEGTVNFTAP